MILTICQELFLVNILHKLFYLTLKLIILLIIIYCLSSPTTFWSIWLYTNVIVIEWMNGKLDGKEKRERTSVYEGVCNYSLRWDSIWGRRL